MHWHGVIPAITTPFKEDLSVDHEFLARHAQWLVENGCTGIVALGSLGEGGTLSFDERRDVLRTCVAALAGRAKVISGVAATSTREAVEQARAAREAGCDGLMVLPPYVYCGDWSEMRAHVGAVMEATALPCMLYNNPIAYKVDFLPEQIAELLGRHANLEAVKESSADVRRILALRVIAAERLQILCGVDDLIVEAVAAGACGWIAGLVNAFPKDSVELFNAARAGHMARAFEIYRWFLPLLRMDTVPKFVQLIKHLQEEAGMGSRRVRPPRLPLASAELEALRAELQRALSLRAQAGAGAR
ncbi:MAG: dihydrodipicolinate synthase family protein [Bryobacteraceae bacterium]|jgi:4-hydroxy-tetrahydrodipicolinate synthase